MKKPVLADCPQCARHVRVDERACPFCQADLNGAFREQAAPRSPTERLGRAALHSLRMGAISVTTAACGGSVTGSGSSGDGAQDSGRSLPDASYDAAPMSDASVPDSSFDARFDALTMDAAIDVPADGREDAPFVGVLYGFPPVFDAGPQNDAPFIAVPYGIVAIDDPPRAEEAENSKKP